MNWLKIIMTVNFSIICRNPSMLVLMFSQPTNNTWKNETLISPVRRKKRQHFWSEIFLKPVWFLERRRAPVKALTADCMLFFFLGGVMPFPLLFFSLSFFFSFFSVSSCFLPLLPVSLLSSSRLSSMICSLHFLLSPLLFLCYWCFSFLFASSLCLASPCQPFVVVLSHCPVAAIVCYPTIGSTVVGRLSGRYRFGRVFQFLLRCPVVMPLVCFRCSVSSSAVRPPIRSIDVPPPALRVLWSLFRSSGRFCAFWPLVRRSVYVWPPRFVVPSSSWTSPSVGLSLCALLRGPI